MDAASNPHEGEQDVVIGLGTLLLIIILVLLLT
jgi:hypothetical protein